MPLAKTLFSGRSCQPSSEIALTKENCLVWSLAPSRAGPLTSGLRQECKGPQLCPTQGKYCNWIQSPPGWGLRPLFRPCHSPTLPSPSCAPFPSTWVGIPTSKSASQKIQTLTERHLYRLLIPFIQVLEFLLSKICILCHNLILLDKENYLPTKVSCLREYWINHLRKRRRKKSTLKYFLLWIPKMANFHILSEET